MKVRNLIEQLQMANGEQEVWISSNGIDYSIVDYVEKDDGEGNLLIMGEIERRF